MQRETPDKKYRPDRAEYIAPDMIQHGAGYVSAVGEITEDGAGGHKEYTRFCFLSGRESHMGILFH